MKLDNYRDTLNELAKDGKISEEMIESKIQYNATKLQMKILDNEFNIHHYTNYAIRESKALDPDFERIADLTLTVARLEKNIEVLKNIQKMMLPE